MLSVKTIIILVLFACTLWARYEVFIDQNINVAPGIVYKHLRVFEKFWNINVLEIDLKNPFVKIETVKAENSLFGVETVSSMAKRRSFAGHQVVAAINADFFDINGVPNNVQVVNGQILQNPINVSALGFDAKNHPWLGTVSFSGQIITKNGNHSLQGVNKPREPDEIVLYNRYYGSSTKTDRWGSEVAIRPITPWIVNDTVWAVVTAKQSFKGDLAIPENGAVLSAQGDAMIFLDNNTVLGDTIALVLKLTPALPKLIEMVGGFPKIVYQGKNWAATGYQEEGGPVHAFQIHPRTAIGFNADSSKFFFFTVDGRKPGVFRGMTLPELADLMIDFGVAYGVNLDGGGSTTFFLTNKVQNFPTEGEERPVAAALLAISTAPDYSLETIQLTPDSVELYYTQKVKLNFQGWDQDFNPLQFNENDVYFETSEHLGQIDESGWFRATTNGAQGYVYLHYKNIVDSTYIRVIPFKQIKLEPEFSVTDTLQPISLTLSGIAENGKEIFLPDSLVTWHVSNPQAGAVSGGEFIGFNEGTNQVIASLNSMSDTITIQVKADAGPEIADWMEIPDGWQLAGNQVDLLHSFLAQDSSFKRAGHYSLRLDYQFVYNDSAETDYFLKKQIDFAGEPEQIAVDFKSDGNNHRLGFVVSNKEGQLFKTDLSAPLSDSQKFVTVMKSMHNLSALDSNAQFHFPIKLEYIWFKPGNVAENGERVSGSVYFDYLRVQYSKKDNLKLATTAMVPQGVQLFSNYPNPFNVSTTLQFELPEPQVVEIQIFDVQGRLVENLLRKHLTPGKHQLHWQADDFASGIYFARVKAGRTILLQKMVLLK